MKVRFEPIGEEIDCGSDETVLDAAFRQGYNLAYGCREGQCSACKCFLLEGEVALKPYSNFALSDSEESSGYSLMCRAMAEKDLIVELLHYDPENYRLEHAIQTASAIVASIESVADDVSRVVLDAPGFTFTPGQYVDLHVDGTTRSFSMANTDAGRIELIVRRYPGGRFSGKLEGQLKPGDELQYTGPYGALRIRESERPILMLAAGSGISPILSLLRHLDATGCQRPVHLFFATRTPLCADELAALTLSALSVTTFEDRSMLDAVDRILEAGELREPDVYMCGPPPMLEAAEPLLIEKHKLNEQRIFQDKFTTAAEADPTRGAAPTQSASGIPATAGDDAERQFSWYVPAKRRATLYEDVTVDTQPSIHRHLTRGWPVSFEDGRGTWDDRSTGLRSSDWFEFRDPGEQWERPYYQNGNAIEQQIEGAMRSARAEGLISDYSPEWIAFLRRFLQIPAYVEHGLWFALATAGRECLSDSVSTCVCLQAAMKQRSAQAIVLYAMDLEEQFEVEFSIEQAREAFLSDEHWQPTRRLLERLAATPDWGEVIVAANLCFEPVVATLVRRELGIRAAAANGDAVTPVLARVATQEWEWARAWTVSLVRFLRDDERFGDGNRSTISGWVHDWLPQALEAASALAPLTDEVPVGIEVEQALERLRGYAGAMLEEAELPELCSLVGYEPVGAGAPAAAAAPVNADARPAPPIRRTRPPRERRRSSLAGGGADWADGRAGEAAVPSAGSPPGEAAVPSAGPPPSELPADGDGGTYDFVGIVMAKSAEGDAVARILGQRDDIVVYEQPAFWDIRAQNRLVIPYDEVSEELGYEIDAYSIQHEMSTHYGRMVATDEALMLFSDPTEAMQHLMS